MSIYLIFSTKICGFSFFWHPTWLTNPFIGLANPFLKNGSKNSPYKEDKTFQETKYFDQVHIYHFLPPKYMDFYFLALCMAKIVFYWLVLFIFEKRLPKCSTKLFRTPNVLIISKYPIFSTTICQFSFFWTPCMAQIAFYWFGLSIFEKGSQNAPHPREKLFRRPNILIKSIYLNFPPKYVDFHFFDIVYG